MNALWFFAKGDPNTRKPVFTYFPVTNGNKTGLQPVSRPVEQSLGFYQKVLKRDHSQRV